MIGNVKIKGFVVAAPMSGSGKTTVTLALMAALKKQGLQVAPFKVGPDFIDPGHHSRVTGHTSRNVDGWMLDQATCRTIFSDSAGNADVAVVEGVMGLFDGYDGSSEAGSTAQMAKWLGLPVLLVVDAASMARSFAALVRGFLDFDPDLPFCGVLANNVGSAGHLSHLEQAVTGMTDVPLLGGIPRNRNVAIPHRHLGLYTDDDHALSDAAIDEMAGMVTRHLDLESFLAGLPKLSVGAAEPSDIPAGLPVDLQTPGVRVGVARDAAFCFYYADNLALLRENGCEIEFFSPMTDTALPAGLDGLYLGGGYPELFAGALSENNAMKAAIQELFQQGMPIYAECGGFMYLCRRLITKNGQPHDMVNVFDFDALMQQRLAALGYREIAFAADTPLGPAGTTARGHEFHYSHICETNNQPGLKSVYQGMDKSGAERACQGWMIKQCLGSYVHLHFKSCPAIGARFADACRQYKEKKG